MLRRIPLLRCSRSEPEENAPIIVGATYGGGLLEQVALGARHRVRLKPRGNVPACLARLRGPVTFMVP
jgi:hypothetical protein